VTNATWLVLGQLMLMYYTIALMRYTLARIIIVINCMGDERYDMRIPVNASLHQGFGIAA